MSKHTPGHWKAIDNWWASSTSKDAVVVEKEQGIEMLLCHFAYSAFPKDDAANARLIAAAPKMYEMLLEAAGWIGEAIYEAETTGWGNSSMTDGMSCFLVDVDQLKRGLEADNE